MNFADVITIIILVSITTCICLYLGGNKKDKKGCGGGCSGCSGCSKKRQ